MDYGRNNDESQYYSQETIRSWLIMAQQIEADFSPKKYFGSIKKIEYYSQYTEN